MLGVFRIGVLCASYFTGTIKYQMHILKLAPIIISLVIIYYRYEELNICQCLALGRI